MIGSCMSAKIVDSNNAVTIYLAISISHFPNSFFHAAKVGINFKYSKLFQKKYQARHPMDRGLA